MKNLFLALLLLLALAAHAMASTYLANTDSGKFHYSDCRTVKHPDAPNFVPYESRDAAIADGFAPCGVCKP